MPVHFIVSRGVCIAACRARAARLVVHVWRGAMLAMQAGKQAGQASRAGEAGLQLPCAVQLSQERHGMPHPGNTPALPPLQYPH